MRGRVEVGQESPGTSSLPTPHDGPWGSHMVLGSGNGTDGGHLCQREGQAHGPGRGEEHAPDQRRRAAVLEAELEAGGHALPRGQEGDGHAEDREGRKIPLRQVSIPRPQ